MTSNELLMEWRKGAVCKTALQMTAELMTDFALRNDFDVREIRVAKYLKDPEVIGWRLYDRSKNEFGDSILEGRLYYVIEKIV